MGLRWLGLGVGLCMGGWYVQCGKQPPLGRYHQADLCRISPGPVAVPPPGGCGNRGGWGDGRVARYDAVLGMAEGNGSPPEERVCVTKLLSLEIAYT
jgi:hypothetical protein